MTAIGGGNPMQDRLVGILPLFRITSQAVINRSIYPAEESLRHETRTNEYCPGVCMHVRETPTMCAMCNEDTTYPA